MIIMWNTRKKLGTPTSSVDPGISNVKLGIKYVINGVQLTGAYAPAMAKKNAFFTKTPKMGAAICGWFLPMKFVQIEKKIVNYANVDVKTEINFEGMWQPFTAEDFALYPNITTSWSWFTVFACPKLELKSDDIIIYKGKSYRVKTKEDWSEYGYFRYNIIADYKAGV
jgi:hypothetical protein